MSDFDAQARDLHFAGCGCDEDATDGCPNFDGDRCTFQQHMIAKALDAAFLRGKLDGMKDAHVLLYEDFLGRRRFDARVAALEIELAKNAPPTNGDRT